VSWGSIIGGALAVLVVFAPLIVKWLNRKADERAKQEKEDEIRRMRQAVGDGDTGSISDGLDRLRSGKGT
jgi:putative component of toxin-antitoxin plasmid stabilization module